MSLLLLLLLRRFLLTTATHCNVKPLISAVAAADPQSAPTSSSSSLPRCKTSHRNYNSPALVVRLDRN
jgi:hypothetical protein